PPRPRRPDRPRDERRRAPHPVRRETVRGRLRQRQRLGRGPLRQRSRTDQSAHNQGGQEDHDRLQLLRRRLRRGERVGDERGRQVGTTPNGVVYAFGSTWVADRQRNAVRTTLEVGNGPLSIAAAGGDVWISNSNDGELWRVSASQP